MTDQTNQQAGNKDKPKPAGVIKSPTSGCLIITGDREPKATKKNKVEND